MRKTDFFQNLARLRFKKNTLIFFIATPMVAVSFNMFVKFDDQCRGSALLF
ncbi:MAG: hypothetical protein JWN56_721 [Sphingobacteriales bacterium]|nr:hypothetical protein [Sphingobacteriales bacterium]